MDRCEIVHENFLRRAAARDLPQGRPPAGPLSPELAVQAFRAGCLTRALDRQSRAMQRAGQGFYTIGSSGHEGLAAVSLALAPDRHGLSALPRRRLSDRPRWPGSGPNPAWDMLLSFASSAEDPISGGRHKVLGSKALMIPPQTSTIASHLPKAVGALPIRSVPRAAPARTCRELPDDAIVYCSFGDASANHSTAQGAFNTAQWTSYQSDPDAAAVCLRRQWHRHFDQDPKGWIAATSETGPG
jgi:2-oxoisovalerate dehydrogenase E1 component